MSKPVLTVARGVIFLVLASGCSMNRSITKPVSDEMKLPIPDRAWDPQRKDTTVGWCGEACIQMAMGYYGKDVSQELINESGHPRHPDLYAGDVDKALGALGVTFIDFEATGDLAAFIDWIQRQLRLGHPVICGCKIYPDENPHWSLDHFVLVVGFDPEGLWLNTQLDLSGQVLVTYVQLQSRRKGYSFANRQRYYFGRAITGVAN